MSTRARPALQNVGLLPMTRSVPTTPLAIGALSKKSWRKTSDTRELEIEVSPRSITQSQYKSLYQIFRTFFDQYPGGQALGHMDVDVSQDDPGFDVRDYAYNNFNKQSLYLDPPNDPALSPQDILKALEGQGPDVLTKDPDVLEKKF